ncbi:MAG TPA: hypothetical protein VGY98_03150, partial [Verrucomicrobiae bacterium]|nr:hypothetical protein [Verrucomicrobiae bacterium]
IARQLILAISLAATLSCTPAADWSVISPDINLTERERQIVAAGTPSSIPEFLGPKDYFQILKFWRWIRMPLASRDNFAN